MYQSIVQLNSYIESNIPNLPLNGNPKNLYDPLRYIISLGGKRTRPLLTLLGCQVFTDDVQKALPAAMAIECFHNFTLIHDDIMDCAPLRRGHQTIHTKWNNNIAILSGDVLYVKSIELMMQSPDNVLRSCMQCFNTTAIEVCEGQQIDMNFELQQKVSIEEYIEMISLKTAVLLGASLKIGALIGGANANEADLLYQFGKMLGISFQLQDDILDVYADSANFGKQVGGDIIANKKTYLYLKAKQLANTQQLNKLMHWEAATTFNPQEKVIAVKTIYDQLQVRQLANQEMENYYQKALHALNNISIDKVRLNNLTEIAQKLLVRIS